jgi:hypothetical protein
MYEDVDLTVRTETDELAEDGKIYTAAREGNATMRLFGEEDRVVHRLAWCL